MKTIGIIAEYNPFHNGHLYQINKAKELSGADYAVVIMSGNFVQRGTPALLDKYARCEAALKCIADLVIELPVCFACASAEFFAKGAVSILHSLHVDALCFGSECGDIVPLKTIADILTKEPPAFRDALSHALESGLSFPMARKQALETYISESSIFSVESTHTLSATLESPNNILGIEYLKALNTFHSSMETYTVKREGSGYSDNALPDNAFGSATAIRKALSENADTDALSQYMPSESLSVLNRELSSNSIVFEDALSGLLLYKLYSLHQNGYTDYLDITPALSDKISGQLEKYISFPQFCDILKSKDITHTRISRSLLHILLDIKKEDMALYAENGYAQYIRILGFREASAPLLGILKSSTLPVISKLADAEKQLGTHAQKQLSQDIFASHIYDGILAQKTGRPIQNEYRRKIVIL